MIDNALLYNKCEGDAEDDGEVDGEDDGAAEMRREAKRLYSHAMKMKVFWKRYCCRIHEHLFTCVRKWSDENARIEKTQHVGSKRVASRSERTPASKKMSKNDIRSAHREEVEQWLLKFAPNDVAAYYTKLQEYGYDTMGTIRSCLQDEHLSFMRVGHRAWVSKQIEKWGREM